MIKIRREKGIEKERKKISVFYLIKTKHQRKTGRLQRFGFELLETKKPIQNDVILWLKNHHELIHIGSSTIEPYYHQISLYFHYAGLCSSHRKLMHDNSGRRESIIRKRRLDHDDI